MKSLFCKLSDDSCRTTIVKSEDDGNYQYTDNTDLSDVINVKFYLEYSFLVED